MTYFDQAYRRLCSTGSPDCSSVSPPPRQKRLFPETVDLPGLSSRSAMSRLQAGSETACPPGDAGEHPEVDTARLEIRNYLTISYAEEIARDVSAGLSADQKRIPSKYFYDERGSRLFEEICTLPEYYPTRTEMAILEMCADRLMEHFTGGDLVEMGSGANWKICRLLDAAVRPHGECIRYVPLDVSESALKAAAEELIGTYRELEVLGIVADFTRDLDHIPDEVDRLITLFGGTIGNFTEEESKPLLAAVADLLRPGDRFVLGMDMVKEKEVLEAAYNDARGVTAAFNKNILTVVNRELGADFDNVLFDHVAFYNEASEQIEMHLAAREDMTVEIAALGMTVEFEKGETIHTEISRKFTRESATRIFDDAGLVPQRWFTDEQGCFSLVELMRC